MRWAAAGGVTLALGLAIAAVAGRWADPAGPGRVLYFAHDALWLPLKGHLWTAPFPRSLALATLGAGLAALVLAEWLTPLGPLRALQISALRGMLAREAGAAWLLAWDTRVRRAGLRLALAGEVAAQGARAAAAAALAAAEAGGRPPGGGAALARAAGLRLALSARDAAEGAAALEALALVHLAGGEDAAARLAARLAALAPGGEDGHVWAARSAALAAAARGEGAGRLPERAAAIAAAPGPPAALAALALEAALAARATASPAAMEPFAAWARARAAGAPAAPALAEAEGMIAFEAWAALAEAALPPPPPPGMLADALGEDLGTHEDGERFARDGRPGGRAA